MRLGFKFALALVVPLVALTIGLGWAYQQRSRELLREELGKEGRAIALVVRMAAEDYLRDGQLSDMRQLSDRITGYERVLGLRLFDREGRITYQSGSLEAHPFLHRRELETVLKGGEDVVMRRRISDQPVVGYISALRDGEQRLFGAVQVLQLESFIQRDADANRDFILALSAAMVLATVFTVLLVTRVTMTRPIGDLVRRFRDVGAGVLPSRVAVRGADELSVLAVEFNRMCERLEATRGSLMAEQTERLKAEARLRTADRLLALGRLSSGLAHELGTPLNVIRGRAEVLERAMPDDERARRHLGIIVAQVDRITRIIRAMLDFGRSGAAVQAPVSIPEVIRRVTELVSPEFEQRRVRFTSVMADDLPLVPANADQIEQVLLNLSFNALDAMPDGGNLVIRVEVEAATHPEHGGIRSPHVSIRFEDTGSGIAAEDLEHVFDPFFTTKEPGSGTGLGLSVSHGIVEHHGGWFDVDSEPGRGTRITLHLPVTASHQPDAAAGHGSVA